MGKLPIFVELYLPRSIKQNYTLNYVFPLGFLPLPPENPDFGLPLKPPPAGFLGPLGDLLKLAFRNSPGDGAMCAALALWWCKPTGGPRQDECLAAGPPRARARSPGHASPPTRRWPAALLAAP